MTRSARLAVGGVMLFVLLLVATVSGLVAAVGSSQLSEDGWFAAMDQPSGPEVAFADPVEVQGEVIDVDARQDEGWASVDVSFPDSDGGTEVGMVELGTIDGSYEVPEVGDTIDLVHESGDPSWVLRADDPMLESSEVTSDVVGGSVTVAEQRAATEAVVRRCGALAVGSLLAALLVGLLTTVAVRRAPGEVAPAPQPALAG